MQNTFAPGRQTEGMAIRTLDDITVGGATLGVRVDINSPLDDSGELADDARLRAHLGTISELLDRGARVALLAHQGRPGGGTDFATLESHAARLNELLDRPVEYCDATFSSGAREAIRDLDDGTAVLLENTRFYSEEYMEFEGPEAAETHLVKQLAPVFDAYVNDAFAAAHRSQPSLVGFPHSVPSYAGRVMEQELDVLGNLEDTPRPRIYVIGGAKMGDAIDVIKSGLESGLADAVLTSGMVGNAFLIADDVNLGDPSADAIYEREELVVEEAHDLLAAYGDQIHTPVDVAIDEGGERVELGLDELPATSAALDIGAETVEAYTEVLDGAGTAIVNGPAGVFEDERFAAGTRELFAAATRPEMSIVGGGDTAAALRRLEIEGFDHVSTGGGAALRMLTGGELPAVDALDQ